MGAAFAISSDSIQQPGNTSGNMSGNTSRNTTEQYVGGSSKIQTLCHMTQVLLKLRFTAMKRLFKLFFFIYKGAGILLTSIYITQRVLATPTLIGT